MAAALHKQVGTHPKYGPFMKGPKGGTYVLYNGKKYYVKPSEWAGYVKTGLKFEPGFKLGAGGEVEEEVGGGGSAPSGPSAAARGTTGAKGGTPPSAAAAAANAQAAAVPAPPKDPAAAKPATLSALEVAQKEHDAAEAAVDKAYKAWTSASSQWGGADVPVVANLKKAYDAAYKKFTQAEDVLSKAKAAHAAGKPVSPAVAAGLNLQAAHAKFKAARSEAAAAYNKSLSEHGPYAAETQAAKQKLDAAQENLKAVFTYETASKNLAEVSSKAAPKPGELAEAKQKLDAARAKLKELGVETSTAAQTFTAADHAKAKGEYQAAVTEWAKAVNSDTATDEQVAKAKAKMGEAKVKLLALGPAPEEPAAVAPKPAPAPPLPSATAQAAAKAAQPPTPEEREAAKKFIRDLRLPLVALNSLGSPKDYQFNDDQFLSLKREADARVKKLHPDEREAVHAFSNGYDFTIRALQRGVSREEMIEARMKHAGGDRTGAANHVDQAIKHLNNLRAAETTLAVSNPTAQGPLYRGMSVSSVRLHEMLTKEEFTHGGMYTSSSLSPITAQSFAGTNLKKKDYVGEPTEHKVTLVYKKLKRGMPMLNSQLSDFVGEREVMLSGDSRFRVTNRKYDSANRTYYFEVEEVE